MYVYVYLYFFNFSMNANKRKHDKLDDDMYERKEGESRVDRAIRCMNSCDGKPAKYGLIVNNIVRETRAELKLLQFISILELIKKVGQGPPNENSMFKTCYDWNTPNRGCELGDEHKISGKSVYHACCLCSSHSKWGVPHELKDCFILHDLDQLDASHRRAIVEKEEEEKAKRIKLEQTLALREEECKKLLASLEWQRQRGKEHDPEGLLDKETTSQNMEQE